MLTEQVKSEHLASKNWGPILANMYLENGCIRLIGSFLDDEKDKTYPGPDMIIAEVPEELMTIVKESPGRYHTFPQWQKYIRQLWLIVKDNPWFGYI